jgi:hypothetical protein
VYRVNLLQLHESQLYSALTRARKPGCVKARDNEHLKLCDSLFYEIYVTFLPTVESDGFQPCLQGNNNNLISSIIITSSIILYGETPDEGWGG